VKTGIGFRNLCKQNFITVQLDSLKIITYSLHPSKGFLETSSIVLPIRTIFAKAHKIRIVIIRRIHLIGAIVNDAMVN
jgi:hypothetical protein